MSRFERRQHQFIDEVWTAASQLDQVEVSVLPGGAAHAADLNCKSIPLRRSGQISDLHTLPEGENFASAISREFPIALVRLGRTGLLALDPYFNRDPPVWARAVHYNKSRMTNHTGIRFDERELGRADVARLYGTRPDASIAERHLSLTVIGATLLIGDLGSPEGTRIITKVHNDYDHGGRSTRLWVPDSVPSEWLPEPVLV